jgi:hypothetical protein
VNETRKKINKCKQLKISEGNFVAPKAIKGIVKGIVS